MHDESADTGSDRVRRIPVRKPAHVGGLTNIRTVARAMVETKIGAVLVENSVGPVGLITAGDVIEAIAAGADPDIVWAGEVDATRTADGSR